MSKVVSSCRHATNVVGCVLIAGICCPVGIGLLVSLASLLPDLPNDPDAGKAAALYKFGIGFCALVSMAALLSLTRSVRALRRAQDDAR